MRGHSVHGGARFSRSASIICEKCTSVCCFFSA
jgi:hypothetical protein